jgi:hypothetical protein
LDNNIRITRSSFIQESRTEINEFDDYIFGVDPNKYSFFAESTLDIASSFPTYLLLNQTNGNNTNGLISHLLFQKLRTTLGSNVSVKIADNTTVNVTLKAVIKSNVFLRDGEYLYIPSVRFQEFFNSTNAKWFVCDVEGDVKRVQTALEISNPELKEVIGITYFTEMMERSLIFQSAVFQVLFIESFILAAIAQFVCILVSTLRMEREVGVMRSFGLNRRGVFGIFMTESIALGVSALLVGLVDGLIGSVLLAWYISLSIPIIVKFPLENIALWLSISFSITILSTILPSYRSSRKNVVATISGRPMTKSFVEKEPRPWEQGRLLRDPLDVQIKTQGPQNPMIHRLRPLAKSSGQSYAQKSIYPTEKVDGVFQFIRGNLIYIQTVFLILMAIVTFNYIFDETIIIRGLISFDYISRVLLTNLIFPNEVSNLNFLFLVNPFLVIIGSALIIPFSHYLFRRENPKSLLGSMIQSLIMSIIGIVVLLLVLGLLVAFAYILFIPMESLTDTFGYDYLGRTLFAVLAFILIVGIWLLVYQRLWCFIITRGIEPDLSMRGQLRVVRRYGSIGATGFVFLVVFHSFIEIVLFYIIGPLPSNPLFSSYLPNSNSLPLNPNQFLFYSIYEVGFFILLIIYQIVQYKKFLGIFPILELQKVEYKEIPSGTLVFRCQKTAERILLENSRGVNIQHDGIYLFSEIRDGIKLLFFQDSVRSIPVAMNYSINYPKRVTLLSEDIPIRIIVPSSYQMEKFLDLVKELEIVKTN